MASGSGEPPFPVTVDPEGYPARSYGYAAFRKRDRLILRARGEKTAIRLSPTAALLWHLCDGQATVAELLSRLQDRYSDQSGQVASDAPRALEKLRSYGVIRISAKPQPARPLIRAAFSGFTHGFRAHDNYFLWMLTHKFDPIQVDPDTETADLLFYCTPASGHFDPHRADRDRTIKIQVSADGGPPDFSQCDFAFSPGHVEGPLAGRHCHLPVWAVHLDWNTYEKSETVYGRQRLPARYKPAQVCNRLYEALSGPSPPEPQAGACPPPHTPGIQNKNRPVSAQPIRKKLTVGMATYDDFDGVYFTTQAIRLYHPEVTGETEILVIDNNPEGRCAQDLRKLENSIPGYRYVAFSEVRSTAARDMVFREARSPAVLCIDSHVLPAPGAIKRLIDYMDAHPQCRDLLQGPLVNDDVTRVSTHFEPVWSKGMYGRWALDERGSDPDSAPFEIPMQGLGLFACRKEAWVGFNPRFLGFGGEEGYLHEKFRQAGGRTLCLPFLRWLHRFQRPLGVPYPNQWHDRIRNYHVGFRELNMETDPIDAHFRSQLGTEVFEAIKRRIKDELANPFNYFDAVYCINLDMADDRWQAMQARFRRLGIQHRVRRFSAVETPESHHIGCALSHRRIIEQARLQGFQHVLVFEDDALFLEETLAHIGRSIGELKLHPWKVFHLGGHKWGHRFPKADGCRFLESPCKELTCTHAVAYHRSVYEHILNDLPDDIAAMEKWISKNHGIDQYLRSVDQRCLAHPVVSSQPFLLPQEDAAYRDRFTI